MIKLIAIALLLAFPSLVKAGSLSGDSGGGNTTVVNGSGGTTNASNITSGTLADARLTANVTLQGNTFNGSSQLVQLLVSGKLPVLDGSNLTGISSSSTVYVNAPLLGDGSSANHLRINSSSFTLQGNAFNGPSQLVQLKSDGKLPTLDGSNLTNVPSTPGGSNYQVQFNNSGFFAGDPNFLWDTITFPNGTLHVGGTYGFGSFPASMIVIGPASNVDGGTSIMTVTDATNALLNFKATAELGGAAVIESNASLVIKAQNGAPSIYINQSSGHVSIFTAVDNGYALDTPNININSGGIYYVGGVGGATGSFTTVDSKTVTVVGGIITAITP